jgi:hypothetical protein
MRTAGTRERVGKIRRRQAAGMATLRTKGMRVLMKMPLAVVYGTTILTMRLLRCRRDDPDVVPQGLVLLARRNRNSTGHSASRLFCLK